MNKTITEAMPELEQIARELNISVCNAKVIQEYKNRHMEIPVRMAIMSHLSDAEELIGVNLHKAATEHIEFAKQLIMEFPDMGTMVTNAQLNELYQKGK